MFRSRLAALAAGSTAAGAALIGFAAQSQGISGYVSEAGVIGAPHAAAYRLGILALAAAQVLLSLALGDSARPAAAVLLASAVATTVSASVSCSPGCPLPPYQPATPADLVHGAASIGGVGLFALALGALALARPATPVRRAARLGFALLTPLGLIIGVFMLTAGRAPATALLERLILATAIGWMLLVAGLVVAGRDAAS